ncbi:hypothetical protein RJ639_014947 [Escallonia herrerae]|uniref:Uncharacterized protein n=1 Tax=Escallonia herrerae TaxID=1293975 RepID=A0AA88VG29_9ASTE|nr:hypothetical protein RJ639_014947 [Escallonia herrerae]
MDAIVLYPSPGMGHLISMVELGKLIVNLHPSISIIILATTPSFNTGSTAAYIRHVSATTPSITFHHLPTIKLDPSTYTSIEAVTFDLLHLNNPFVCEALQSISTSSTIAAIIMDLFCTPALSVAADLKIPAYYFFTSGAGLLALFLYIPTIDKTTTKSFNEVSTLLHVPSLPPIPSFDMIMPMLDRTSSEYASFVHFASQLPKAAGVIVNTFENLEHKQVKAINEGECLPDVPTPPVFCVGPLIAADGQGGSGGRHECLSWLDSQPGESVVFLCFGSLGVFSAKQLKEIAVGLERSEQRVLLVRELKLALPMTVADDGFVSAAEVEKRVRELMESEGGRLVRDRVTVASEEAKLAMKEGGSSHRALVKLVESLKLR